MKSTLIEPRGDTLDSLAKRIEDMFDDIRAGAYDRGEDNCKERHNKIVAEIERFAQERIANARIDEVANCVIRQRLRFLARAEAAESLLVTERAEIARGHALLEAAEAEAQALREELKSIATMPEYDQDDAYRLRDHARCYAGSGEEQIQEENV
jgi:hypothetical protein